MKALSMQDNFDCGFIARSNRVYRKVYITYDKTILVLGAKQCRDLNNTLKLYLKGGTAFKMLKPATFKDLNNVKVTTKASVSSDSLWINELLLDRPKVEQLHNFLQDCTQ